MLSDAQAFIGTVLQETYRVERVIGSGGMGAVFELTHLRLGRSFAAKILSPEIAQHQKAFERFQREAKSASAILHPHIVEVIDFNQTPDGMPYMVMEHLYGEDLAARIAAQGQMPLSDIASIFRQVTSALQAAHDKGVIHRDLKPANVFLCQHGQRSDYVKLLDFGICKIKGATMELTQTNTLLGTPAYMTPEQIEENAAAIDARTDIYALATILFEMLMGQPPFTATSIPSLLYKIASQSPPSICAHRPEIPIEIEDVVRRALAKKPDDRFATADAFWEAFAKVLSGTSILVEVPTEDREADWIPPAVSIKRSLNPPLMPFTEQAKPVATLSSEEFHHCLQPRFIKRRKSWIAMILVAALALWAIAVIVPMQTTQEHHPQRLPLSAEIQSDTGGGTARPEESGTSATAETMAIQPLIDGAYATTADVGDPVTRAEALASPPPTKRKHVQPLPAQPPRAVDRPAQTRRKKFIANEGAAASPKPTKLYRNGLMEF